MANSSKNVSSSSAVADAVVFNVAILLLSVGAFLFLRPRQPQIYQSRTKAAMIPDESRPKPLAKGIFRWFTDLVTRPDSVILRDAGLDGYFFLRYMRSIAMIMMVGVVVLYPILLPVNATGGGTPQGQSQTGFDILAFGNVQNPKRYYAHVFMSWIFYGFIIFTLYREVCYYVAVRQAVLTSPFYSNRISSRSILIGTVPKEYLSVEGITSLFDGVKNVWINRNFKKLNKKVKERAKLANKIEGAETNLLKKAVKTRLKSEKKGNPIESTDINDYVPPKKRPTYRLKPIIGKKVDTIEHASTEIQKLNPEIAELQSAYYKFSPLNSAFVLFETQAQAEFAFQTLAHHQAFRMAPRYIGVRPDDVFWPNLRLLWWERLFRATGAAAVICVLVIFWAVPVAFVGALSNIDSLTQKLPWLKFVYNLPPQLFGLISSLLPTILLAVLMALLPPFIRAMGMLSGYPTGTLIEYYAQQAYFAFQVIQVFLVTTITSGATAVVEQIIDDPTSAMGLLASNLPKASNFYISYFLLQGFSACGAMLLQIVTLVLFHALRFVLDKTPRKIWNRWNVIGGPGWGIIFPVYTNLAVIAITYSIIAPILVVFAALTFGLIYIAYLHNLMFISLPTEGRGMYYVRAIYQTFVGLYIGEICLLGLFVVAKAWGPIVLEAILIGATVFVQVNMQSAFAPLEQALPRDLLMSAAAEQKSSSPAPSDPFDNPIGEGTSTNAISHHAGMEKVSTENSVDRKDPGIVDEEHDTGLRGATKKATKHVGMMARYFQPYKYLTPERISRDFLPDLYHQPLPPLSDEEEAKAFCHPSITDTNPVVWFPRDPYGLSTQQVELLSDRNVDAHDDHAWFAINEKKKKARIETSNDALVPTWSAPITY
ncbi:uncharacterized protein Rsn1p [Trichomonascus vanleenenianus]|uniref:Rsn1p n=1 Tax=Trichomonascus vanleenenianus TaxID=2268995 RepID=UPI003ECB082C